MKNLVFECFASNSRQTRKMFRSDKYPWQFFLCFCPKRTSIRPKLQLWLEEIILPQYRYIPSHESYSFYQSSTWKRVLRFSIVNSFLLNHLFIIHIRPLTSFSRFSLLNFLTKLLTIATPTYVKSPTKYVHLSFQCLVPSEEKLFDKPSPKWANWMMMYL